MASSPALGMRCTNGVPCGYVSTLECAGSQGLHSGCSSCAHPVTSAPRCLAQGSVSRLGSSAHVGSRQDLHRHLACPQAAISGWHHHQQQKACSTSSSHGSGARSRAQASSGEEADLAMQTVPETSSDFSDAAQAIEEPGKVQRASQGQFALERGGGGAPRRALGQAVIRVCGIGGGGCNAVNHMVQEGISNVEFWAIDTDVQSLRRSVAPNRLQIGPQVTGNKGAGSVVQVGEEAAEASLVELAAVVAGADLVFIAVGMGRGTGTGAAPVLAEVAKKGGALTVAIATEPFPWEGKRRMKVARTGLLQLQQHVDTLVVVPNHRLLDIVGPTTPMEQAFRIVDDVLRQGVQGISDIITVYGLVNVDFADVRAVMTNAGSAMMGIGVGRGRHKAVDAATAAINSQLLDGGHSRPTGLVYNITGGSDLSLVELGAASEIISSIADPNANIIFGAVIDENYKDMVRITVIATGMDREAKVDDLTFTQYGQSSWQGPSLAPPQSQDPNPPQRPDSPRQVQVPELLRKRSAWSPSENPKT